MNFSSLAIHCASLCCDVMQRDDFLLLSHEQINHFYDEVYRLIKDRTELHPDTSSVEHEFIRSVTLGVLKALHICRDYAKARSATWLLKAMQSRISSTSKRLNSCDVVRNKF